MLRARDVRSLLEIGLPTVFCTLPTSFITCLTPSASLIMASELASRYSGAGVRISLINMSARVKAESMSLASRPIKRRMKLPTLLKKRCNALMSDPFGLSPARSAWNCGFDIASATNSSRFLVPYAVPSISFTSSNNLLSCLVVGFDLLSSVAEVSA